ncbi:MAG: hypothetical protein AB7V48_05465 [Sedimentibacter sp.]
MGFTIYYFSTTVNSLEIARKMVDNVLYSGTGRPFYRTNLPQYLFFGVPLNKCYGWGQEVYAPCDGEIIKAEDGYKERQRVHLASDLFVALKNA